MVYTASCFGLCCFFSYSFGEIPASCSLLSPRKLYQMEKDWNHLQCNVLSLQHQDKFRELCLFNCYCIGVSDRKLLVAVTHDSFSKCECQTSKWSLRGVKCLVIGNIFILSKFIVCSIVGHRYDAKSIVWFFKTQIWRTVSIWKYWVLCILSWRW